MAHPFVEINKESFGVILERLKETLILVADKSNKTEPEIDALLAQYVTIIDSDVFALAVAGITQYINFYNVAPREGIYDEFKNIYFLGAAISQKLDSVGLADLRKLHQLAILRLLDLRLVHPYKVNRPTLTERVVSAIKNDSLNAHFGLYGWYITYKCLYNAALEAVGKKGNI